MMAQGICLPYRQYSAAGIASWLHAVNGPVTGPSSARSRVAVSMGKRSGSVSEAPLPLGRLADHQQRQGTARKRPYAGRVPACAPPHG